MESVSYDRFTTPEAEINHMGQKLLYDSGEKDFFILWKECLYIIVKNCVLEKMLTQNKSWHLTKKD